jgi:hypothetical protein
MSADDERPTAELDVRAVEAAAKLVERLPLVERPVETCTRCDRPIATSPNQPGCHAKRAAAATSGVVTTSHQGWRDLQDVIRRADADCRAHYVDWRARALAAEDNARGATELWRMATAERDQLLSDLAGRTCELSAAAAKVEADRQGTELTDFAAATLAKRCGIYRNLLRRLLHEVTLEKEEFGWATTDGSHETIDVLLAEATAALAGGA